MQSIWVSAGMRRLVFEVLEPIQEVERHTFLFTLRRKGAVTNERKLWFAADCPLPHEYEILDILELLATVHVSKSQTYMTEWFDATRRPATERDK